MLYIRMKNSCALCTLYDGAFDRTTCLLRRYSGPVVEDTTIRCVESINRVPSSGFE